MKNVVSPAKLWFLGFEVQQKIGVYTGTKRFEKKVVLKYKNGFCQIFLACI